MTLAKLSEEEEIRQQCAAREKNEMDMRSCFAFGMEQGLEKGKEQTVLSLVQDGTITPEIAALKLGMSLEEIESKIKNM